MNVITSSMVTPKKLRKHAPDKPAILKNTLLDWPALTKWNTAYFYQLGKDIPVTLIRGNRENGEHYYVNSTFGNFLNNNNNAGYYLVSAH